MDLQYWLSLLWQKFSVFTHEVVCYFSNIAINKWKSFNEACKVRMLIRIVVKIICYACYMYFKLYEEVTKNYEMAFVSSTFLVLTMQVANIRFNSCNIWCRSCRYCLNVFKEKKFRVYWNLKEIMEELCCVAKHTFTLVRIQSSITMITFLITWRFENNWAI